MFFDLCFDAINDIARVLFDITKPLKNVGNSILLVGVAIYRQDFQFDDICICLLKEP